MKSIIEAIVDYVAGCPLLEDGRLNLDYLGADPIEYVVESIPCDPVYTQYTDGGCLWQYLFVFASREAYGTNTVQNLANSQFYEQFAEWLRQNNDADILPRLPAGCTAQTIEPTTGGYVLLEDTNHNARYQIQCRLLYTKEES